MKEISGQDIILLKKTKDTLENIGLLMQGLNFVGDKIKKAISLIPAKQRLWVGKKTNSALLSVIKVNLKTMSDDKISSSPLNKSYKGLVTASGVGFGFLGFIGFAADLVITTKFMMRSIMDIARSHGEDLNDIETQLSCLEVFAIGGKSDNDDGMDTSYYATRMALRSSIQAASLFIAENGAAKAVEKLLASGPLLKLVGQIASRFESKVLEQFAVKGAPIAGAIGGGAINLVFMHHFQKMADAHFTLRKLERKYGEEVVRKKYQKIKVN